MNYRTLQNCLKAAKKNGWTTIRLNSEKEVLQAEYTRILDTYYSPQPRIEAKPEPQEEQVLPPTQRSDYPQMLKGLTIAAQERGYAANEAKTFARKFFECWESTSYANAYNKYLQRVVS